MSEVMILAEVKDGSLDPEALELLGAGRTLAGSRGARLSAVMLGESVGEAAARAGAHGADRVYVMEHALLKVFDPDLWLAALVQACNRIGPKILLMGHGPLGMEIGPRLAYRLNTRLTTDCIALAIDPADGRLLRTKPVSGGNAIAVFKCPGAIEMATVRSKVFEPAGAAGIGEIVALVPEIDASLRRVESVEMVREEIVSLDKADVVVAGGAGLGDQEGFDLLRELERVLSRSFGKVMIGCSRVAVDKGWISSDHQVGLTGSLIAPDIYVAVGISGAIQHLVGMVHSRKIIAINTDPGCNIFKVADYGVVEDYARLVPALVKRLEELS